MQVTGLPDLPATPALADELRDHFERLYGTGSVAEVVLATRSAELMPLFASRAAAKARRSSRASEAKPREAFVRLALHVRRGAV